MDGLDVIDSYFWHGKRVFLTGHTGFKGSWLALWLSRMGAHVVGYALAPTTSPSLFELAEVEGEIDRSIIGDVRDYDHLLRSMKHASPDVCFHLAAQPLVRESYAEPVVTFSINLMGTVNVLEACRQIDTLSCAIIVTTDKCYENNEWPWPYRENDPLGGADLYSASKACAELATQAYRLSFFKDASGGVQIASVRAGNVIGGGDWSADRLIPDCIRAFGAKQPVKLRSPSAVRPWQHVLEPLAGYLLLAQKLSGKEGAAYAGSWNFGPDACGEADVAEVAQDIADAWGDGAQVVIGPTDERRKESGVLRLDSTKARVDLGWRPIFSFAQTIYETVAWYKQHKEGAKAKTLTMAQIERYEDAIASIQDVR